MPMPSFFVYSMILSLVFSYQSSEEAPTEMITFGREEKDNRKRQSLLAE